MPGTITKPAPAQPAPARAAKPHALPVPQAALHYADRGWLIVILHRPTPDGGCTCGRAKCESQGKHPRASAWQRAATADKDQLTAQLARHPESNIGLRLGPWGIIDVEYDTPEGKQTAEKLFGECHTPTYKSERGLHRLFRWTDALPRKTKIEKSGLDFRLGADKAVQSVLPPSLHPSGATYQWLPGLSPDEVEPAELPPNVVKWLTDLSNGRPLILEDILEGVAEGRRHEALRVVCGHAAHGCRTPAQFQEARKIPLGWNKFNRPPLPEKEILEVFEWTAQREKEKPVAEECPPEQDTPAPTDDDNALASSREETKGAGASLRN